MLFDQFHERYTNCHCVFAASELYFLRQLRNIYYVKQIKSIKNSRGIIHKGKYHKVKLLEWRLSQCSSLKICNTKKKFFQSKATKPTLQSVDTKFHCRY